MFKLLSWNIRQGGGSRVLKIINKLSKENAHVVILSEYRNNASGNTIRNGLLKAGYRYQNVTASEKDKNAAAIFSKMPADQLLFPNSDIDYPHNVLSNRYDAFEIIGMYLPHKKKHNLFDLLIKKATNDFPVILAGDFNTGKNHIDQKGNSFWYTDKLVELEKAHCIDAFRFVHGDANEYSWYSHQGNGYRYDHTYISQSLTPLIKDCYYLHKWREEGLSDHSPMVLELG